MCEMRVTRLDEPSEEAQFEEVTSLEFEGDSVAIHSLFEEPRILQHTAIHRIDCLTHRVVLRRMATPKLLGGNHEHQPER